MLTNGYVLQTVEAGRRQMLQIVDGNVLTLEVPPEYKDLPDGEYDNAMKPIPVARPTTDGSQNRVRRTIYADGGDTQIAFEGMFKGHFPS